MACCADCAYMDLNDSNSNGDYWCGYHRKYYPGSDSACSHFQDGNRSSGGGCYITTIICDILGYEDHCHYLEQLRNFRDNHMKLNSKYENLLIEYDDVGPVISKNIRNDKDNAIIANYIFENYIKPVASALECNEIEKAVNIYKTMVLFLKEHYNMKVEGL